MFEDIKIFSTLECVWGFTPKNWQSKSYEMDILFFENYLSIEHYSL